MCVCVYVMCACVYVSVCVCTCRSVFIDVLYLLSVKYSNELVLAILMYKIKHIVLYCAVLYRTVLYRIVSMCVCVV